MKKWMTWEFRTNPNSIQYYEILINTHSKKVLLLLNGVQDCNKSIPEILAFAEPYLSIEYNLEIQRILFEII